MGKQVVLPTTDSIRPWQLVTVGRTIGLQGESKPLRHFVAATLATHLDGFEHFVKLGRRLNGSLPAHLGQRCSAVTTEILDIRVKLTGRNLTRVLFLHRKN